MTDTQTRTLSSDAHGNVAYFEPGRMGKSHWFQLYAQGWNAGGWPRTTIRVVEGGGATIVMSAVPNAARVACAASTGETEKLSGYVPWGDDLFRIRVHDSESGRGIPSVELAAAEGAGEIFVTDSNGLVAFYDGLLMDGLPTRGCVDAPVEFVLGANGYPSSSVVDLELCKGGRADISLTRLDEMVAERLYRMTGAGIYRDSVMLDLPRGVGDPTDPDALAIPIDEPLEDSFVIGQDSGIATDYQGGLLWIWGDTNGAWRWGEFNAPGARTAMPTDVTHGGLDVEVGINYDYFVTEPGQEHAFLGHEPGFVAGIGAVRQRFSGEEGASNVTWLNSLTTIQAGTSDERVVAAYSKQNQQNGLPVRYGIAYFDDETERFEDAFLFGLDDPVVPAGASPSARFRHAYGEYAYFDSMRVAATADAMLGGASAFEAFTADPSSRDENDELIYGWRNDLPRLRRDDAFAMPEIDASEVLEGHLYLIGPPPHVPLISNSSAARWNPYRGRFIRLITPDWFCWIRTYPCDAARPTGEVFYAEADTPMGPWLYARQIISHHGTTLYAPRHLPFFDKNDGRTIFFQGTVTKYLSPAPAIAHYNYNQQLFKLDLDDPRLILPLPVYDIHAEGSTPGEFVMHKRLGPDAPMRPAAFLAMDRPGSGNRDGVASIPVGWTCKNCERCSLSLAPVSPDDAAFWALPPEVCTRPDPDGEYACLWEYAARGSPSAYSTDGALPLEGALEGYTRAADPIVSVWRNRVSVPLPVTDYLVDANDDADADFSRDDACAYTPKRGHASCDVRRLGRRETAFRPARERCEDGLLGRWRAGRGDALDRRCRHREPVCGPDTRQSRVGGVLERKRRHRHAFFRLLRFLRGGAD